MRARSWTAPVVLLVKSIVICVSADAVRCPLGELLAHLPDRPEQYWGQDRRGEAVEAVPAEIHHIVHANNVGERRSGRKYEQRDPDPTNGRREQHSDDDNIDNGTDIAVGNTERPC